MADDEVTKPAECKYCGHWRHKPDQCLVRKSGCQCPYGDGIPEELDLSFRSIPIELAPFSTTGHDIDPDGVDHPAHYNMHPSGYECIDVIRHHNLDVGSAIKYLWRQGLKDGESSIKDLSKAIWFIEDEIKRLENLEKENS